MAAITIRLLAGVTAVVALWPWLIGVLVVAFKRLEHAAVLVVGWVVLPAVFPRLRRRRDAGWRRRLIRAAVQAMAWTAWKQWVQPGILGVAQSILDHQDRVRTELEGELGRPPTDAELQQRLTALADLARAELRDAGSRPGRLRRRRA